MQSLGASAAAATVANSAQALVTAKEAERAAAKNAPAVMGPGPVEMTLNVNGQPRPIKVEPCTTLLAALREHLGMTGSKEICDRGACGGCSVIIDGTLTVSCMMLAIDAVGSEITTVEGLAKGGKIDPIQEMFIKHDALQCGYCTPGLVVASRWLLNNNPSPTLNQIRHALAGNICRCGTYTNVFNAVLEASGQAPLVDGKLV